MSTDDRQVPVGHSTCPFCVIVADDRHGQIERWDDGCIVITPLDPVVESHKLVIPVTHVEDATTDPAVSAYVMAAASRLAAHMGDCNLITSVGAVATQSVFHLHVHVVPRRPGDGLALPWSLDSSGQKDASQ